MATEGFEGFYVETRNYGATAAFWGSLGFQSAFETDHGSGQWMHPAVGRTYSSPSSTRRARGTRSSGGRRHRFAPDGRRTSCTFTPQHWGVVEAAA